MMENYPATFDQAQELLRADPLPADIIDQLDKLRSATPAKFRGQFDWFYEGAVAASGQPL